MAIDPVVFLAEEIRILERELKDQCRRNEAAYDRDRMETINLLVGRVRALYGELLQTAPSSALGAAELIRVAAHFLPFAQGRYATHLHRIAERLGAGQRLQADLIWLRALGEALAEQESNKAAPLLALAVRGIAQPVVVYRAAAPSRPPAHTLNELSLGPRVAPFLPERF